MTSKRPLILVTNDDGIHAPGIRFLIKIMNTFGDVVVVARNAASPYEVIDVRWEATTTGTVTLDFSAAPSSSSVRVGVYAAVAGSTITIGSIDDLISNLVSEDKVDLFKNDDAFPFFIEEEIISKGEECELLNLLNSEDFDPNKIVSNYNDRLIELATIQGNLNFVKLIHEKGSNFYNSLDIATDNLKYFPVEGFEEIIEYINTHAGKI